MPKLTNTFDEVNDFGAIPIGGIREGDELSIIGEKEDIRKLCEWFEN